MQISCCWLYAISKYGYPPNIEDTYRAIGEMADLGFRYIELEGVREHNLLEVAAHKEDLKTACEERGLRVVNFCPVLPDLVSLDKNRRRRALELFEVGLEMATFFDCETIQIDSYTPPLEFVSDRPYKEMISFGQQYRVRVAPDFDWERLWATMVDSISACNARAKETGLRFCLEPRVGEIVSNTDALLRLMDAVGDDNFGAVLDTGHLHAQKEILPLSVEKLGQRVFYLHVSDNDGLINEHRALGEGTVDWEGVFTALKKHGFDDYVALDIGHVPDLDRAMIRSRQFLQDLLSRLSIPVEG